MNLVEFDRVSVVRDGVPILHDVSFVIAEGEHVAILGPNGSGKTTLLRLLAREIYPFAGVGEVRVLGSSRWDRRDLARVLGVVHAGREEPILGDPTVLDWVASSMLGTRGVTAFEVPTPAMIEAAGRALHEVQAEGLMDRRVETLSAGERRRADIARALAHNPPAVLLDEPTTSLDLLGAADFLRILRGLTHGGRTLVLVTHHAEEIVPEIDRVILLAGGRVVADGPKRSVLSALRLSEAYGRAIDVLWEGGIPRLRLA